ncbi:MAG: Smr/MutS family protein [Xanthomonadales bacterium]|nr:Smr/MutS family protein [Xanthomonadaceae bacterium]MBN8223779.1 Smr/MutS family protein [Xanthomonadales bacterium]
MHEDEEDPAALFRAAVGKVAPLRKPAQDPPAAARPRPARRPQPDTRDAGPRARCADDPDAVLLRGDASAFRRERVTARDWQRLRRGQFSAQDELDLHGANALQAETLLARFLAEATGAGLGCVRIVHGKGGATGEGVPVLKNLVDRLLRQRGEVLAFHTAPPAQGGTGALLVLLARR